jgi:hypothetical protein
MLSCVVLTVPGEGTPVNMFQSANGAATFLILSAIVGGLAKRFDGMEDDPFTYLYSHLAIIYLGLFLVVFRVKMFLDDHRHFGEQFQDKVKYRYVGFVLAVLSWLFWGLAAYLLTNPLRSSELMAAAILISTLWVGVHLIEIATDSSRRNLETLVSLIREKWILINIGYVLCLGAFLGWFRPVIAKGDLKPLYVLLLSLTFDVVTSRSFTGILKTT